MTAAGLIIVTGAQSDGEKAEIVDAAGAHEVLFVPRLVEAGDRISEAVAVAGTLSGAQVQAAEKLRWVHSWAAGANNDLVPEMMASPVTLTSSVGNGAVPLAEHSMLLMMMLNRDVPRWARAQSAHLWDRFTHGELAGATVGIVGLGHAGADLALKAKAFHMNVVGVRRRAHLPVDGVDRVFAQDELLDMLPLCDFVVVTAPITPGTHSMFGEREFRAMKDSAHWVCISRGGIADDEALLRALREGWIAGAGLDAHGVEPLPAESPFWDLPNVVVTPHNGATTEATARRGVDIFLGNLRRFVAGEPLENLVDKTAGYCGATSLCTDPPARRGPAALAVARPVEPVRRRRGVRGRWITWMFLTPWLIGLVGITIGPMLASLYLSFTDYNLLGRMNWIGLDNYIRMFTDDPRFLDSAWVTLRYVVISVPLQLAFALAIAVLLNQGLRGLAVYRSVYYLPSLLGSSVAIAVLWRQIFGSDGLVNQLLQLVGLGNLPNWIATPEYALGTLILLNVWTFGSPMIIFLAGLRQVPGELYEAASVDGAGRWMKFWKITIPMISPVIFFNLVLQMIGAFQTFTQAYIVSGGSGGPVDSTLFYTLYLYQKAFTDFDMGYASAMAWILLLIIGAFTAVAFGTSNRWVHYGGEK